MKVYSNATSTRSNIRDLWNSDLVEGARWSERENPIVNSTATSPPHVVVSYKKAKEIYKSKISINKFFTHSAYIHFYIDDDKFDGKRAGIWINPSKFFEITSHFSGVIGPDFSIYADFPDPLKRYQVYRCRSIEIACVKRGIPLIVNARWGSFSTWSYTLDELPKNSMLAIGTVGSRLRYLENQYCFNSGFEHLIDVARPHTLIVVGSANYPCFEMAKSAGIKIIQFDGETCKYFKNKKGAEND